MGTARKEIIGEIVKSLTNVETHPEPTNLKTNYEGSAASHRSWHCTSRDYPGAGTSRPPRTQPQGRWVSRREGREHRQIPRKSFHHWLRASGKRYCERKRGQPGDPVP